MPRAGTRTWICDFVGCNRAWPRQDMRDRDDVRVAEIVRFVNDLDRPRGDLVLAYCMAHRDMATMRVCSAHMAIYSPGIGRQCPGCADDLDRVSTEEAGRLWRDPAVDEQEPDDPESQSGSMEWTMSDDTSTDATINVSEYLNQYRRRPRQQSTGPPTPDSIEEDDAMACALCGDDDRSLPNGSATHLYDPETMVISRDRFCSACWNSRICYCHHDGGHYYHPQDVGWGSRSGGGWVPCQDHSPSDDQPEATCNRCGQLEHADRMFFNKFGRIYCEECTAHTVRCGSGFCQARWHVDDENLDPDTHICRMHAPIDFLPSNFPDNNPHTWDRDPNCSCEPCRWLRENWPDWFPPGDSPRSGSEPCHRCAYPTHRDDLTTVGDVGDLLYCHRCIEIHLDRCDDCDRAHPTEHLRRAEQRMGVYCDSCMESRGTYYLCAAQCQRWFINGHSCNCGGVYPYNYKPSEFTFYRADGERADSRHTPFLGIELEIEAIAEGTSRRDGAAALKDIPWAYPVHDGSLAGDRDGGDGGDLGFEIVTHPFTYLWFDEHWSQIEGLLNYYAVNGYRSWEGENCGMHVHISRAPMSDAHQLKFLRFFYGSTNLSLCIGQRGFKSRGVKRFAPFTAEDPSQFLSGKVRRRSNPGVRGHYCAINTSLSESLEARWFRGTLNPKSFRKNIEFIHSVWEFTEKFGHTSANEINYIGWLRSDPERRRYATLLDFIERNYITRR